MRAHMGTWGEEQLGSATQPDFSYITKMGIIMRAACTYLLTTVPVSPMDTGSVTTRNHTHARLFREGPVRMREAKVTTGVTAGVSSVAKAKPIRASGTSRVHQAFISVRTNMKDGTRKTKGVLRGLTVGN